MNIRVKKIPLDPVTFKVDLKAMQRAITRRTCMVSSNYSYLTRRFSHVI